MALSVKISENVVKLQKNTKITFFFPILLTSKETTTSNKHVSTCYINMKLQLIYKMHKMSNGGSWSHIDNKLKISKDVLDRMIQNHLKWSKKFISWDETHETSRYYIVQS